MANFDLGKLGRFLSEYKVPLQIVLIPLIAGIPLMIVRNNVMSILISNWMWKNKIIYRSKQYLP